MRLKKGDRVLYYHTGKEKAVVGVMEVVKGPYADPEQDDPRLVVVDVKPVRRFARPVVRRSLPAGRLNADSQNWRGALQNVRPDLSRYGQALTGDAPIKIAVEAAVRQGWDAIIGADGLFIGMTGFGASAPAKDLYRHFGITAEAVVSAALAAVPGS